jgi:hypothetical protein
MGKGRSNDGALNTLQGRQTIWSYDLGATSYQPREETASVFAIILDLQFVESSFDLAVVYLTSTRLPVLLSCAGEAKTRATSRISSATLHVATKLFFSSFVDVAMCTTI